MWSGRGLDFLAEKDCWNAFVNVVMNLWFLQNTENTLNG
jgi:hypothetical protein